MEETAEGFFAEIKKKNVVLSSVIDVGCTRTRTHAHFICCGYFHRKNKASQQR